MHAGPPGVQGDMNAEGCRAVRQGTGYGSARHRPFI
jgi:hypothetical protein